MHEQRYLSEQAELIKAEEQKRRMGEMKAYLDSQVREKESREALRKLSERAEAASRGPVTVLPVGIERPGCEEESVSATVERKALDEGARPRGRRRLNALAIARQSRFGGRTATSDDALRHVDLQKALKMDRALGKRRDLRGRRTRCELFIQRASTGSSPTTRTVGPMCSDGSAEEPRSADFATCSAARLDDDGGALAERPARTRAQRRRRRRRCAALPRVAVGARPARPARRQLGRPESAEYLCGNRILPGSEPAAHCYCGHQFGHFAGQLGDGATMYLGEVLNPAGERWELQLKGGGRTHYSRQADGRKVLRSSLREFLCSEHMHALGVPTTRAGSLVTSDTRVARDINYDGNVIQERASVRAASAPPSSRAAAAPPPPRRHRFRRPPHPSLAARPPQVVTRIAQSFLRFGSFEICKPEDALTGRAGPSAGQTAPLLALLDHVASLLLGGGGGGRRRGGARRAARGGVRRDRAADGGARGGVAMRRLLPRSAQHRQHVGGGRDDRLRAVRVPRLVRPRLCVQRLRQLGALLVRRAARALRLELRAPR